MIKKLMIFGGSGFVGGNMAHIAQRSEWEVFNADTRPGPVAEWRSADITDRASVEAAFNSVHPDAVVDVAAIADIDLAEQKKELAYKVNVDGARFVAESCAKRNIPYVFFSSDAVFDGEGAGYSEEDVPKPLNYYGRTKQEAEQAVLRAYPSSAVIRISLVLGFPLASGNSFFAGLHAKLKAGKTVLAPTFEVRTPVDVGTLSECVLELCANGFAGIMHIGATDSINRYDLTRILARRMSFDERRIQPQNQPDDNPARAPRHKNGIIRIDKARSILKTRLLSTEAGIERAFQEICFSPPSPAPDR